MAVEGAGALLECGLLGYAAAWAEVSLRGEMPDSRRGCGWRVQRKVCTEWRKEGENYDEWAGNVITGRNQDPAHNTLLPAVQIPLSLQESLLNQVSLCKGCEDWSASVAALAWENRKKNFFFIYNASAISGSFLVIPLVFNLPPVGSEFRCVMTGFFPFTRIKSECTVKTEFQGFQSFDRMKSASQIS